MPWPILRGFAARRSRSGPSTCIGTRGRTSNRQCASCSGPASRPSNRGDCGGVARPEQEAKGVIADHALRLLLRACHPNRQVSRGLRGWRVSVDEGDYWVSLEYRVCREFARMKAKRCRHGVEGVRFGMLRIWTLYSLESPSIPQFVTASPPPADCAT